MSLPFKYATFSNNMGRGLTQKEELQIIAAADPQHKKKEVIKMADEEKREDSGRMVMAKTAIEQKLALLDAELKKLRAERNAVARALRGLGKFY